MPRESHLLSREAAPLLVSVLPLLSHHIRDGLFRIPEFLSAVMEKDSPSGSPKASGTEISGNRLRAMGFLPFSAGERQLLRQPLTEANSFWFTLKAL